MIANFDICCLLFNYQEKAADLYPVPDLNDISPKQKKPLRTTNAYFYWVTKEQGSFDWFRGVMNEVAELDQRVNLTTQSSISFLLNFSSGLMSLLGFGRV